jgi:hypothetical protein
LSREKNMNVKKELEKLGGCAGGIAIYNGAKGVAYFINADRPSKQMPEKTQKIMRPFFPKLKLCRVRYRTNAQLPGNWFKDDVSAMTFGYTIFFKGGHIRQKHLALLMHELVHVDQVRRLGDSEETFACKYGEGFLKGGSYERNPMEIEAREFVERNQGSLPATSSSTGTNRYGIGQRPKKQTKIR